MSRFALVAVLALAACLQIHRLDDADTWWHLATGRTIWTTGAVPRTDPFSFTAAGAPWINRQWLFEIVLYASWLVAGPAGPSLVAGAAFVAAFALLARLIRRRMPGWATALVVVAAVLAAVERFTVRPEALTYAFLAVSLLLTDGRVTARTAAALVALQLVWANCHALSVLGLVPIGAALAAAVAAQALPLPARVRAVNAREPAEVRNLAAAFVGAAVAEAATPFGLRGAVYPLWLFSLIRGDRVLSFTIVEHRATRLAELSPVASAALVAILAASALAIVFAWRRLRFADVINALSFGTLALLARRNVALAGFGLTPLIASALGPPARAVDAWLAARRLRALAGGLVATAALVLCAGVVTGRFYEDAHLSRVFGLGESLLYAPVGAVDFLTAQAPEARVLNDDEVGGYLIWRGRPVFLDGRLQVYPEDVYLDWQHVLDDPRNFAGVAARRGIGAVVLHHPSPGRLEIAQAVANTPGWRIAFLDGAAIVLLRDGGPIGTPVGATGPMEGAATPGLAGTVERGAAWLRLRDVERATMHYQRGRAIVFLWGPQAFGFAHQDFRTALALDPGIADAATGFRMTEVSPSP